MDLGQNLDILNAEAIQLIFIRMGAVELRLTEITENIEPIHENVQEILTILSASWPHRLIQLGRGLLNFTIGATQLCKWYFTTFFRRRRD